MDLLSAILTAVTRSKKFFSIKNILSVSGLKPQRRAKVIGRLMVQKVFHSSALNFPHFESPGCFGGGDTQVGSLSLAMSSRIACKVSSPKTWVPFAFPSLLSTSLDDSCSPLCCNGILVHISATTKKENVRSLVTSLLGHLSSCQHSLPLTS